MPLRNPIEAIVTSLPGAKTFYYGTANEINNYADQVETNCFVCLYPLPPVTITLAKSGSANNFFDLYMEFLFVTKFEKDTADNEDLVNQALLMANRFLAYLRDYKPGDSYYFVWSENTQARAMPVYNKFDVNTTGVNLTFKVKTLNNPYLLNCE